MPMHSHNNDRIEYCASTVAVIATMSHHMVIVCIVAKDVSERGWHSLDGGRNGRGGWRGGARA